MSRLLSLLVVAALSTSSAFAQVNIRPGQAPYGPVGVGVGVGIGAGYRPWAGAPFGYFGYYPGAYSSSWSNGFSLYGPPVPTYGSVPGTFGGADQRLSNFGYTNFGNIYIYNGASIGLGGSGAGGAGPRRRHYTGGDGIGTQPQGLPATATGQATIQVSVPVASAEVYFEGINTRQQGVKRTFQSPDLQIGMTYYYKVSAKWSDGGNSVERARTVGIKAGETTVVDFTRDEPETPPQGISSSSGM